MNGILKPHLQIVQPLATLQLHGPRSLHLIHIGEEPALGVLDHAIANPHLIIAFVPQLAHVVNLGALIQLVELAATEIFHVGRVDVVVDIQPRRGPLHNVWRHGGIEAKGWAGSRRRRTGKEGREEREDEEEEEWKELSNNVPGRRHGFRLCFTRSPSRSGSAELMNAETWSSSHVEDELRSPFIYVSKHALVGGVSTHRMDLPPYHHQNHR